MRNQLVVYEEDSRLVWGLLVIGATAFGTYLLGDVFVREAALSPGLQQFAALASFSAAFWGIFKATEPLYRFRLTIDGDILNIRVFRGDTLVDSVEHPLGRMEALMFMPRTPPGQNEALIDFTPDYYLVLKLEGEKGFRRLIDLSDLSFTLKVKDIGKIVRFIREHNPDIQISDQQKSMLGL